MRCFHHPRTDLHEPSFFLARGKVVPNEERPLRSERLKAALTRVDLQTEEPPEIDRDTLVSVHTRRYLDFLGSAAREWSALEGAGPEVVANVQPRLATARYPLSIVGRAGWHLGDCACPIGPRTAEAAFASAASAHAAAKAVAGGAREAYALARPPGHHAAAEVAAGHCYLNNAALAASTLAANGARVAILDIDVHHGNGTEAIFLTRPDILTVSVHADPNEFYPFFGGQAAEAGSGAGEGFNLNLPLPLGSADAPWLEAIGVGITRVQEFAPDAVVLALGFDAFHDDPLTGLKVTESGFIEAGRITGALPCPIVITQEGGYLSPALTENAAAFFGAFLEERR